MDSVYLALLSGCNSQLAINVLVIFLINRLFIELPGRSLMTYRFTEDKFPLGESKLKGIRERTRVETTVPHPRLSPRTFLSCDVTNRLRACLSEVEVDQVWDGGGGLCVCVCSHLPPL